MKRVEDVGEDDETYSELFLVGDPVAEGLEHLFSEVVLTDVQTFQLIKSLKVGEECTHCILVINDVVLKGECSQLGHVCQVSCQLNRRLSCQASVADFKLQMFYAKQRVSQKMD